MPDDPAAVAANNAAVAANGSAAADDAPPAGGDNGKDLDFEALYRKEIKDNQNLRTRAQDAEKLNEQNNKDAAAFTLKRLEEDKQFKEANEILTGTVTALETENADYKGKFKVIADAETKERETLIEKLPEDDRALYEGVTLPNLRQIVAKATETNNGVDTRRPGGKTTPIEYSADMTPEEKKEWLASKRP